MIATLYAAVARRRREWYAAHPDARRRLRRPVISIGNIASGGRGKTPFTAAVARMLLELGERPAILSRGYARTQAEAGVVIVRDALGIRSDVARAGDEPFMLARQLPGVIVLTSSDRYLAGRLAEHQLGATVHILDDGFQHFQLDRDADVVLVSGSDLESATFPTGRLREPPDVLVAADAVVALDGGVGDGAHRAVFRARRINGPVVFEGAAPSLSGPTYALAGIADPQPFFSALERAGLRLAGRAVFRDHHPYSTREADRLFADARAAGAAAVVTTEKDYVRLLRYRPFPMPVGWLPLTMEPEPVEDFKRWLESSIASTRDIVIA
ncbi:MAG: tetraacyldisaccharide 4'-kinase [Acidobacteriota bacterium]|nr:tetraacyldisaccharide 4'-kinase [Acidobacteriota bacterium]